MSGWSRTVAVHEAGHAVAFLALGIPVERVEVFKRHGEKMPLGTPQGRCRGTQGNAFLPWDAVSLFAGPIAEARHRKRTVVECLINSGDLRQIDELLAVIPDEAKRREMSCRCEFMAKRIVRARWTSILALANVLVRHGHVIKPTLDTRLVMNPRRSGAAMEEAGP